MFESEYSFDLESLKKQNLGEAVKRLQKLDGATPFIVAYAVQTALGGHSIPVDRGTLGVLYVLGVISEAESASGNLPGMERAIPKSKGQEFGSLLHQLGAEFVANPFSPPLRELLLSIAPDAKDRFPKRVVEEARAASSAGRPSRPAKKAGKDKDDEPEKPKDKGRASRRPRRPAGCRSKRPPPSLPAPAEPAKKKTLTAKSQSRPPNRWPSGNPAKRDPRASDCIGWPRRAQRASNRGVDRHDPIGHCLPGARACTAFGQPRMAAA